MRIFVASVMNEVEMVFEGGRAALGSDTRGGSFYISTIKEAPFHNGLSSS